MPKQSSFTSETIADRALQHFWVHGYNASSMDDLVKATGVSRHGIYSSFGGKKALFLACFERYQMSVVTPAFEVVEKTDASLDDVARYFDIQITRGEEAGLPGPGCFVANAATEVAPSDADVMAEVTRHNRRLLDGFTTALNKSRPDLSEATCAQLAQVMVVFTNGLWTMSRNVTEAEVLRAAVSHFLSLLSETTQ